MKLNASLNEHGGNGDKLGYWTTRWTLTRQLADCQLADWTTHGLDNSRMPLATLRA